MAASQRREAADFDNPKGADMSGRKSMHDQWLTDEALLLLEGWARDGMTDEQIEKLIDENVLALNAALAAYSKIGYTEIRRDQFEKTPKQSIRRFMYS